jgi:hypothetical protein
VVAQVVAVRAAKVADRAAAKAAARVADKGIARVKPGLSAGLFFLRSISPFDR